MSSIVNELYKKRIINCAPYVSTTHYEVVTGSVSYGVSNDMSDMDIVGICIPHKNIIFPHLNGEIMGFGRQTKRFEQWQQHHVMYNNKNHDMTVFNIVKFFQLAMENNPNIIDVLFTPRRCVLHTTNVGNILKDNRKEFLHKGSWYKFKGYAYSQLNKLKDKNMKKFCELCDIKKIDPTTIILSELEEELIERKNDKYSILSDEDINELLHFVNTKMNRTLGKRVNIVSKHGYDCYDKNVTEFLTDKGWKFFDEITHIDKLATLNNYNEIIFEYPNGRIEREYTGNLYNLKSYNFKCCVTEYHNMLVSQANRNIKNNFSTSYVDENSKWEIKSLKNLIDRRNSYYHVRIASNKRIKNIPISDNLLKLCGFYISEGTILFRGTHKSASITQTVNGKMKFFEEMDKLCNVFKIRKYVNKKETIWRVNRNLSEFLYNNFGYLSKNLKLPKWTLQLSYKQAKVFWDALCLGDGTINKHGSVYYTSSYQLAKDIHAMMISSGFVCNIRGPYESTSTFNNKSLIMYQIYLPNNQKKFPCIILNKKTDYRVVYNHKVVCFDMPNNILITKCNNNVAIQGNCKFAYHIVRLLDEVEQILTEGNLDLERNREQLKSIRRGEWSLDYLTQYFYAKEAELENLYTKSELRYSPDEPKIKSILLMCLKEYFGELEESYQNKDQYKDAICQIRDIVESLK